MENRKQCRSLNKHGNIAHLTLESAGKLYEVCVFSHNTNTLVFPWHMSNCALSGKTKNQPLAIASMCLKLILGAKMLKC